MIIILPEHAGIESIHTALAHVNEYFHDNIRFKTCESTGKTRDKREKFTVTLTVNNSNEIGSKRSFEGRKIAAACWHAHGVFFDSLPAGTEIRTSFYGSVVTQAGDPWHDLDIGSAYRPLMASDACNCMDWNTSGVLPFPVNM
jgi:hypothetical protein